ncbi:MAG: hypothetical protein M1508_04145 [Nitrospirae bacterium]|nr:hypothetical protein [Nitrospirota bacterium]MCL5422242.1 hypothetical protein [Nitrospirota bacterium]
MATKDHAAGVTMLIFCLLAAAGCDVILGPPGYEPPLSSNPPGEPIPLDMVIEGEPNLNLITVRGGYYIWKTGDTWNMRVAKTDMPHITAFPKDVFTGAVSVENGFIANVVNQNVKPFDDVRSTPNGILFRLEGEREIKGMSFQVQPMGIEYCVSFDLRVNGAASPQYVFLGKALYVPEAVPMRVCVRK